MNVLRIGNSAIDVRLVDVPEHVRQFVEQITDRTGGASVTHTFEIRSGTLPSLLVDGPRRHATLHLPPTDGLPGGARSAEIGVMQAAARSLAAMGTDDKVTLLHGSAVTMDGGRSAVAVLDGGRGQGKTSLAMGLAIAGGHLLVDEFTFLTTDRADAAVIGPQHWPWHIRPDMSPLLWPACRPQSLLGYEKLGVLTLSVDHPVPLRLVLIPDTALRAGQVHPVGYDTARRLLRPAVTDHLVKLRDPALDHVSIFGTRNDITIIPVPDAVAGVESVLDTLERVTVFRVGIGAPHDLPATVAAATNTLVAAS